MRRTGTEETDANTESGGTEDVERSQDAQATRGFIERVNYALGPIAGGIILDVVDFASFGPLGLYIGWLVGGLTGWWIGSIYRFSKRGRALLAIAAAVYCSLPGTEFLPLATLVSAFVRFWDNEPRRNANG